MIVLHSILVTPRSKEKIIVEEEEEEEKIGKASRLSQLTDT